jgi:hypothetical protein
MGVHFWNNAVFSASVHTEDSDLTLIYIYNISNKNTVRLGPDTFFSVSQYSKTVFLPKDRQLIREFTLSPLLEALR